LIDYLKRPEGTNGFDDDFFLFVFVGWHITLVYGPKNNSIPPPPFMFGAYEHLSLWGNKRQNIFLMGVDECDFDLLFVEKALKNVGKRNCWNIWGKWAKIWGRGMSKIWANKIWSIELVD
jgi:hypothetical protein